MSPSGRLARLLGMAGDARPAPRTLVVVAHPDDEVIGAASLLPRLGHAAFVHVTDGSPPDLADARAAGYDTREAYAAARRRELLAALALAGIGPEQARTLDIPDQHASFELVRITLALLELIWELRPEVLLTHAYEGGHPDHDATAFAAHAARALLAATGDVAAPLVAELAGYHAGNDGAMRTGEFLPARGRPTVTVMLDDAARDLKRRLFAEFATQARVLEAFAIGAERFRPAPRYDFSRPPHAGRLFYERFEWGVTGERWRALAADASARLGIAEPA
ncbi:MAG TPA: PIG-L family deacetylase [Longimicrobiales bacterium]|nr:PIG-L family deacetylase [Longimicrobiales bacterium]